ncbi:nucleolin 1-like [Miscanthus floridulus]|uniref:nucleolin 1-like n=1 Tax=Miscanthus floridulus TaxID=154761 RepID=UPI00345AA7B1
MEKVTITYDDWRKVPKDIKGNVWGEVKRQFMSMLNREYVHKGRTPFEDYNFITHDVWEEFVMKQSTGDAKDKGEKFSELEKRNELHHHLGMIGCAAKMEKWWQEEREAAEAGDNNDEDKKSEKKDKKEKKEKKDKMTFNKKNDGSYVVTWDSDASSSDDDDDSDDDKTTNKKAFASIAINEKPSLFDTPSCFMTKATKVQSDDECDDEEYDNENENESDSDDDEPTKDELLNMPDDAKEHFDIKRRECKSLRKELKALKQAFDELNASHESLKEDHEELCKIHKKLEKAHSSLLNEQKEKRHVCIHFYLI